jgi:hypothetical protein
MFIRLIQHDDLDDYGVWACLERPEDDEDATDQPYSFIIGSGATAEEAIYDAKQALEANLNLLGNWLQERKSNG